METSAVSASPSYAAYASPQASRAQGNAANAPSSQATEQKPQDDTALQDLKARDKKVRQHEQAHLSAAGGLAHGGASFSYERGSDGLLYAVGGEVSIDVSAGATPAETIAKAQQIRAAAQAPADPSPQDRSVAAEAGRLELAARAELAQQQQEQTSKATQDATSHSGDGKPAEAAGLTRTSESAAAQHYQKISAASSIPVSQLITTA